MKCFIHSAKEAVAACKKCGKGMCVDCSAYSGHTGICPECKREEFIEEKNKLQGEIKELKKSRIIAAILGVLFCWLFLIPLLIALFKIFFSYGPQIKTKQERVNYLTGEITKLNKALSYGSAEAIV